MQSLSPTQTLQEQTYRAVLDAICDGTLAPGERLTQEGVAERLSVSRQPVAQALALLKRQGFVQETGRRGLVVADIDPEFFRSIYELRAALDPMAARLAAARMTPEAAAQGHRLVAEGKHAIASGSLQALVQCDAKFHMYIYELSGNPLVPEVMGLYWNHQRRAMGEVLRVKGEAQIVWRQHEEMLEGLISGDAKHSAQLAHDHILAASARTLSVVTPVPG